MLDDLFELMAARRGHFLLESGHHGELWLEVDRIFVQSAPLRPFVVRLAENLTPYRPEALCGPLTGGAFLAQLLASEMGLPFVYADRVDRPTRGGLFPVAYPIPAELAEFVRGRRVGLVNDVINAGSAVRGALASLRTAGALTVVMGALLVLGDAADAIASDGGLALEALQRAPNSVWTPHTCPLCAAHEPLINPAENRSPTTTG